MARRKVDRSARLSSGSRLSSGWQKLSDAAMRLRVSSQFLRYLVRTGRIESRNVSRDLTGAVKGPRIIRAVRRDLKLPVKAPWGSLKGKHAD